MGLVSLSTFSWEWIDFHYGVFHGLPPQSLASQQASQIHFCRQDLGQQAMEGLETLLTSWKVNMEAQKMMNDGLLQMNFPLTKMMIFRLLCEYPERIIMISLRDAPSKIQQKPAWINRQIYGIPVTYLTFGWHPIVSLRIVSGEGISTVISIDFPKAMDRCDLDVSYWIIVAHIMTSWWFQPNWKILVKLDHFPE